MPAENPAQAPNSVRKGAVHLETGQETADGLLQFIADVGRDNLFVNFDPANMILYGTGEPIEALLSPLFQFYRR